MRSKGTAGVHPVLAIPCSKRHKQLIKLLIPTLLLLLLSPEEANAISVEQCCRDGGVPDICARTLCNPGMPPSDFAVYEIFEKRHNCTRHLTPIAKCLAAGRDHSGCCAREAKDLEETACFGMCRGDGNFQRTSYFQTCIAINLASMFSCFEKGYRNGPSQPRDLEIESVASDKAELRWKEPEFKIAFNGDYLINVLEANGDETGFKLHKRLGIAIAEATGRKFAIDDLQAGTRYLVQVIAVSVSNSTEGKTNSLPAEIHFKTAGTAPKVEPYKHKIHAVLGSDTTIGCRMNISGGSAKSEPEIRWEHKSERRGAHYQAIDMNERFSQSWYNFKPFRSREMLATLEIKDFQAEDAGAYKCKVADEYGQSEGVVILSTATVPQIPHPNPPETPLDCCLRLGVQQKCLAMCGTTEVESRRYVPRPFMQPNCSGEVPKVLSCAMPVVDESGCCLSKKVPSQCLYLCDHRESMKEKMPPICLEFLPSTAECRIAGAQKRPSVVGNLKAHSSDAANSVLVRFEPSLGADLYYIYWRNHNGPWQHRTMTGVSKKLSGPADELVLVAVNAHGLSQPARLKHRNGRWEKV